MPALHPRKCLGQSRTCEAKRLVTEYIIEQAWLRVLKGLGWHDLGVSEHEVGVHCTVWGGGGGGGSE